MFAHPDFYIFHESRNIQSSTLAKFTQSGEFHTTSKKMQNL